MANYTADDLQGKPITVKCVGLKPTRTTTITDASGKMITNITRIQIDLNARLGGLVPSAMITLLQPVGDGIRNREETATTDNVQIEIDAIAEVYYEQ